MLRSHSLSFIVATLCFCLLGCGAKDDSAVRTSLTAAGAMLTPGDAKKPVDAVTLSVITDAAKLDEAVALLPKLSVLKIVRAPGSGVNDSHMETIGSIPTLIDVNLTETKVTDAGVKHLTGCTKLFNLSLYGTEVSDACLEDIGKLTGLHILNLGKTKVSGDLSQLANLKELEWLVVSDLPELPDSIADTLGTLPNFSHLQMTNTKISDAAIAKLRKARVGIKID